MQASSAGTVAGPSLCLPHAAGRCVPSLACLELSGRKATWDCAPGLRTAPLSSAPPGMCYQPPWTVAFQTPVSSTSTTPSAWGRHAVETFWAPASEEARAWESTFQEGAGLPLRAPRIPRVLSPGPHSWVCRSLCPFCRCLRFIFPISALSRACGKVSCLHPLGGPLLHHWFGPSA